MPDEAYWVALATDYLSAYVEAFPGAGGLASEPSHRDAIVLAMSVAEHETNNGRAWSGQNNFGAVQLRRLTLLELAAYHAGALKAGDYTPSRDGCLRVDTHPGPSGPEPYPMWFAAFPTRVAGIVYFLKALWRLSGGAPDSDAASPFSLADAMYQHGYYEGAHHGARPVGQRSYPLNTAEQANVTDYANAIAKCMATIYPMLTSWDYGRDVNAEPTDTRDVPTAPELPVANGSPLPFDPDSEPEPPKAA